MFKLIFKDRQIMKAITFKITSFFYKVSVNYPSGNININFQKPKKISYYQKEKE